MVSVTIVTWNSAKYLKECFAALALQDYPDLEVIIVDNASEDETRALLREVEGKWRVIYNDKNIGFAAGQNQAIRDSHGNYVLCLNPDLMLSPNLVSEMVKAGESHFAAGAFCGKLLRWMPNANPHQSNIIDSTGIYFTPNMRHLDRGAEEIDRGQYDRPQYVFGASGAAAFFRRSFIDDVSVEGEFFDEEFFAFREDGDLAWRAQLMGWKCLYTPTRSRVACAPRNAGAPQRSAAGHQLAFGQESLSHARQERVRMAVLASVFPGSVARSHDLWLRCCPRSATVVGGNVLVEGAR